MSDLQIVTAVQILSCQGARLADCPDTWCSFNLERVLTPCAHIVPRRPGLHGWPSAWGHPVRFRRLLRPVRGDGCVISERNSPCIRSADSCGRNALSQRRLRFQSSWPTTAPDCLFLPMFLPLLRSRPAPRHPARPVRGPARPGRASRPLRRRAAQRGQQRLAADQARPADPFRLQRRRVHGRHGHRLRLHLCGPLPLCRQAHLGRTVATFLTCLRPRRVSRQLSVSRVVLPTPLRGRRLPPLRSADAEPAPPRDAPRQREGHRRPPECAPLAWPGPDTLP